LKKVVERLDLNAAWGKKYTSGEKLKTSESLQLLKGRLEVRPVRNTSLIEIRAFSDTPSEAANLANTVTDAYVQYARASSDGIRVEVVDTAIPGLRPVRPNKPLNIIIGIVTGVILGLACGACAAWLARRAQFPGS
jgi:capsular polysaccharide biosynthesis protein